MSNKAPTVKILVGYHKPAVLFKNEVFVPIHLGRALATQASKDGAMSEKEYQWMLDNMIGDDTGDNISHLNRRFCESTAIYWAWKNYQALGNPDFIGLMHYRRFFAISEKEDKFIPFAHLAEEKINLFSRQIKQILAETSLILPLAEDVTRYNHSSILHHYSLYPIHYPNGLQILKDILSQKYPFLLPAYEEYFNGHKAYFASMFIMQRENFFQFAPILFDVLFSFQQKIDLSEASLMQYRAVAYLSEYFTGMYLYYLHTNKKYREIPRYLLGNTNLPQDIKPAFSRNNIPVVFSADDNYAPYLTTCILSLIEHSTNKNNYDILIIDGGIKDFHKDQIAGLSRKNISIRFVDIQPFLSYINKQYFYLCSTHTIATYYRFFIPEICKNYDKIIYLDPDTIILKDVADLYKETLEGYALAAAPDIGMRCHCRLNAPHSVLEYITKTLHISDYKKYFQAGVILFNIPQLRKDDFTNQCLQELKRIKTPRFVDQDVMNAVCKQQVKLLEIKWNVEWHLPFSFKLYERLLSKEDYVSYLQSRKDPWLIHFTGPKPWKTLNQQYSDLFWLYARKTPCYEEIIYKNIPFPPHPAPTPAVAINDKQIYTNVRDFIKLPCYKFDYLKYRILSHITWGKKKQKYKKKKEDLKHKIQKIKSWGKI